MSELTLSISISRKVNLGGYESCDVFQSISGITPETTEAQMDELLAVNGALAYSKLKANMAAKLNELDAEEWERLKQKQSRVDSAPALIPVAGGR